MYVEKRKSNQNVSERCSNCYSKLDGDKFNYRISFVCGYSFDICERCANELHEGLNFEFNFIK